MRLQCDLGMAILTVFRNAGPKARVMVVVYVCVSPALVLQSKFGDIFPPESTLLAGWSLWRGYDDPRLWPPQPVWL